MFEKGELGADEIRDQFLEGMGRAACTASVVTAIFLIIVVDLLFTVLFYYV